MFILPKIEAPYPPLLYNNLPVDVANINSYLQTLVGYFYSCNAPVIEKDQILPTVAFNSTTLAAVSGFFWPPAVDTSHVSMVNISSLYTGGAITFKIRRRATVAVGVAIMNYNIIRIAEGTSPAVITSGSINFTASDIFTHTTTITFQTTSLVLGDTLRLDVARNGTNVSDTCTDTLRNDSVTVSFI